MPYNDNLTLDEIKQQDILMVEEALQKKARHYKFPYTDTGAKQAQKFIGYAVDKALKVCGVRVVENMNPKMVERLLKSHGVKIETRQYKGEQDGWRSGTYIYKDDELAYFVSIPTLYTPNMLLIDQRKHIIIKTNVEV